MIDPLKGSGASAVWQRRDAAASQNAQARNALAGLSRPREEDPLTKATKVFKKENAELLKTIDELRKKKPLAKAAQERVARAKIQIEALKQQARQALASGNKALLKSIAREIGRLGRELAGAAKDMKEAARAGAMDEPKPEIAKAVETNASGAAGADTERGGTGDGEGTAGGGGGASADLGGRGRGHVIAGAATGDGAELGVNGRGHVIAGAATGASVELGVNGKGHSNASATGNANANAHAKGDVTVSVGVAVAVATVKDDPRGEKDGKGDGAVGAGAGVVASVATASGAHAASSATAEATKDTRSRTTGEAYDKFRDELKKLAKELKDLMRAVRRAIDQHDDKELSEEVRKLSQRLTKDIEDMEADLKDGAIGTADSPDGGGAGMPTDGGGAEAATIDILV